MSLCILQKAGQFLDLFRHNLMDIDVDPRPYGTHSFRRGGAQFLHHVRRWSIIKVCDWGGWSKDNDAQSTIFKYLLSWNDSPHHTRREMLHPSPPLEDRCHTFQGQINDKAEARRATHEENINAQCAGVGMVDSVSSDSHQSASARHKVTQQSQVPVVHVAT